MFKLRRKNVQAKKHQPGNPASLTFEWKSSYNWLVLLSLLIAGSAYLAYKNTLLSIKTVQLAASFENINQKEVEQIFRPFVGEGFFSLDIHALQKELSDKAWTDSVSIRRIWPDRLDITIVEKKPVARWDKKHLLSDKAVVYAANTRAFQTLPLVHAENGDSAQLLQLYYQLSRRFEPLGEGILSLHQDSRGSLDIVLADGLKIKVGRETVHRKIARLIDIYARQIQPRREKIQKIDLRYANGFAVSWKKEHVKGSNQVSLWSNSNV